MTITPRLPSRATRILIILGIGLIAISTLPLAGSWLFYRYAPASMPAAGGPNAIWAGHKWVGESHSEEDYDRLAADYRRHRITDVYFHVGPLTGEGLIPQTKHPYAAALIAAMRQRAPEVRLHAWIGQVERRGGGPLDISDAATRANIVQTAAEIIDIGFDGIHYNIEPIHSGDADLLSLLDATAPVTRARGKLLSMATDELTPVPGAEYVARLLVRQAGLWRADYYREVAARTDQIAVMMYDTAMPFDWLYGTITAWETWRLMEIVGPETTLFMGVPTYEEEHFGFHPSAENMQSGLRGIGMGLGIGASGPNANVGAAIYAGWTTDADEWAIWRRDWLDGDEPG
ncbi:MAG: hypothetical protein OEZ03_01525 [Alphaproteobacteria bacterium]|nr:hypothetical protein [Alphaproteobacteria bacterium]